MHFLSFLTVTLIALKLTNHITWSWWIVTSPLWFGYAAVLGIGLLVFLIGALIGTKSKR